MSKYIHFSNIIKSYLKACSPLAQTVVLAEGWDLIVMGEYSFFTEFLFNGMLAKCMFTVQLNGHIFNQNMS